MFHDFIIIMILNCARKETDLQLPGAPLTSTVPTPPAYDPDVLALAILQPLVPSRLNVLSMIWLVSKPSNL